MRHPKPRHGRVIADRSRRRCGDLSCYAGRLRCVPGLDAGNGDGQSEQDNKNFEASFIVILPVREPSL
jgi:hypothetical protein